MEFLTEPEALLFSCTGWSSSPRGHSVCLRPGITGVGQWHSNMPAFLHGCWESTPSPAMPHPLNHLCSPWTYFLTVKSDSSELTDWEGADVSICHIQPSARQLQHLQGACSFPSRCSGLTTLDVPVIVVLSSWSSWSMSQSWQMAMGNNKGLFLHVYSGVEAGGGKTMELRRLLYFIDWRAMSFARSWASVHGLPIF